LVTTSQPRKRIIILCVCVCALFLTTVHPHAPRLRSIRFLFFASTAIESETRIVHHSRESFETQKLPLYCTLCQCGTVAVIWVVIRSSSLPYIYSCPCTTVTTPVAKMSLPVGPIEEQYQTPSGAGTWRWNECTALEHVCHSVEGICL
jgi:hypothetical protein